MSLKALLFSSAFLCISSAFGSFDCPAVTADDQDSIKVAARPVSPASAKIGSFFADIKGEAIDGRKFQLSSAKKHKATVIAMTNTSCPICRLYVATLAKLEKKYSNQGIRFCFVNTTPTDKLSDIEDFISRNGIKGPYIHDKTEKLKTALGVRTTAEVFVFDSAQTLLYRGAVDDQYGIGYKRPKPTRNYLSDALDEIVVGKPVYISATTAPGCDIEQTKDDSPKAKNITYHNQVSRIIQKACVNCHREEGLAPFSLESPEDLASHAGMIRTVIEDKRMPPWFATEDNEHQWKNKPNFSDTDRKQLLTWLASDRKLGDPKDAPVAKKFSSEWNIGEPDQKIKIERTIAVKANGFMDYKYSLVRRQFNKDTWISACEIRPTDPEVVHHVLVFVKEPNSRGGINGASGFFAAYVPGNSYQIFPPGFAKKIPAGSELIFQLHYTPNGTPVNDRTVLGLKYFKGTPKHILRVKGIAKDRRPREGQELDSKVHLVIPPNNSSYSDYRDYVVRGKNKVRVLAFMPHMHLRGKAFKYELTDPDGNKSTLLDVPKYDFNWQLVYRLTQPIDVQPKSKIRVTATFDNNHLTNPAITEEQANETVQWGDQTDEEMLLGYVEYYIPAEKVTRD